MKIEYKGYTIVEDPQDGLYDVLNSDYELEDGCFESVEEAKEQIDSWHDWRN